MKKCKVKIRVSPLANLFNPPKVSGFPSLSEMFEDFVLNNYNMELSEYKPYERLLKEFKPISVEISCKAAMLLKRIPDKHKPEFFYVFNLVIEDYTNKLLGGLAR